jgi:hypothetical protein
MAKLIPSGVVNLPNFAELQYNLVNVKLMTCYCKRRSAMESLRPALCRLFKLSSMLGRKMQRRYAADPSAANYAALSGAYDRYSKAHGAGKFLFEAVKERDAKFYNEPTKWGISVDQYSQDSDNLIKTRYNSFDELLTAASGISDLRPATQLKPESPEAFAKEAVAAVDPMDFLDTRGVFNEDLARKRYKDIYSAKTAVEDRKRNNLIYTAANKGLIGTKTADGFKLDNLGEVDLLFSSPNFDTEGMLQEYGDQGEEIYVSLLKRNADEAYKRGIKQQELGMEYQRLRKDLRGKENEYAGLEPLNVSIRPVVKNLETGTERFGESLGQGRVIDIESAPVKSSTGGDIIKFGFANGKNVIVEQVKTKDDEKNTIVKEEFRVPNSNDMVRLRNATGGYSTQYFEELKRESKAQKTVPSQGQRVDAFGNPI